MGVTAENLAKKYNITRADADAFALRSQTNWANGTKIASLYIANTNISDELTFEIDDFLRIL